jgi:hypothetical protein
MSRRKRNLEEFFSKYEANFNAAIHGDERMVAQAVQRFFADCFVESSPAGVVCGQNNNDFIARVRQRFEFYKEIGSKGMSITSKDITLLDDLHASVKVYWRYSYEKNGIEGSIDFHNVYLLTLVDGEPKIFAYIAGDEQKALKLHGLIHEEAEV